MSKSIKQKLRDAEKQNHEKFRQRLHMEVSSLLRKWDKRMSNELDKNLTEVKDNTRVIKEVKNNIRTTNRKLDNIHQRTLGEVKRFKRGFRWTFYAGCFLFGLLGSFTGIALCGAYWPTIMWLLGQ